MTECSPSKEKNARQCSVDHIGIGETEYITSSPRAARNLTRVASSLLVMPISLKKKKTKKFQIVPHQYNE